MTWEQKLAALKSLTETHLKMREPGNWYVSAHAREVQDGCVLSSSYGNGATPEEAVEDDFRKMTAVKYPKAIVVNYRGTREKRVRWNGFMWESVND